MRVLRALLAGAGILAGPACTVHQAETPELTGPSNFVVPLPASPPTAQFTFTPASPTANIPVAFNGSMSCPEAGFQGGCVSSERTITSYAWDFGDGSTAPGPTTAHVFKAIGSFNVSLTVVTDRGLTSTASKSVTIAPGAPPTAQFVFSPTNPAIGQSVSFNGSQSKAGPGHAIVNYAWDFGDGGKAGGVNPTHAFGSAGTFIVVLIVTDEAGQTAAATQSVPVQATPGTAPPAAEFVFSPTGPTAGQSVSFNASQSKAATGHSIVSYNWNFGDTGTGSGVTTSHTFGSAGTYSVVLVVTDDLGQTGTASKVVPVGSTSPTPPPTAAFVFSPATPAAGQSVSFNATQSTAAAGHSIVSYSWNFGDGNTSSLGPTTTNTFASAGTYNVVLKVTDDLGQTGTVSNSVPVSTTSSSPPTASFLFSPSAPLVGQSVSFNASQSTPAAGRSIVSYTWSFGDGTSPATGVITPHTFNTAATFNVVLVVTDDLNQTGTVTRPVTVVGLIADFTFSPTDPFSGTAVSFNANISSPLASITSYDWDFGDGTLVTKTGSQNFLIDHSFFSSVNFTFTVRLTIHDGLGRVATTTKPVPVKAVPGPTAAFTITPSPATVNVPVTFEGAPSTPAPLSTIVRYEWDFGDGSAPVSTTAPTTSIMHTFTAVKTYIIKLTVFDSNGRSDSTTHTLLVQP